MNHRKRFKELFNFKKVDRIPIYFFGTWLETKQRWIKEGFQGEINFLSNAGPQIPGMDPDWEYGMWNIHRLVDVGLIGELKPTILEETKDYIIKRNSVGDIYKESKKGSSIVNTIDYALKPTRESWKVYKKYLSTNDKRRRSNNWEKIAEKINLENRVIAFMGGGMYGWLRNWMGIENISYLMHDDPKLLEEIISFITDFFIEMMKPILKIVQFDLVYFFEDCCGSNGPLFSPEIYKSILDKYYKKLIKFYKDNNVKFALVDSDGKIDTFIPLWLKSGFDIIFPVEVGTWKASPIELRKKFGQDLKIMGAIDKHIIALGEGAIKKHLVELKPEVIKGGFLPIPDHRIPPSVSYKDMLNYIKIFNEVFNC